MQPCMEHCCHFWAGITQYIEAEIQKQQQKQKGKKRKKSVIM